MKTLVTNYSFDKTAKTVTLTDYTTINQAGLLLITNTTDGQIIYNFADPTAGATVAGNVITLEYDTTSMDNGDAADKELSALKSEHEKCAAALKSAQESCAKLREENKALKSKKDPPPSAPAPAAEAKSEDKAA
jgi:hypothetical protein